MTRKRDASDSVNNRGPADIAAEKAKENRRQGRAAADAEEREANDDKVEEASEESFPASDPPGYGGGHS